MNFHAGFLILPELQLILECCKGQTTVEDAITMKKLEMAYESYDPDYNIIVDFRPFESAINQNNINRVGDFVQFLKTLDIKTRISFLTTKPHQVIVAEMMKKLTNNCMLADIEVFSTIEAAANFTGVPAEKIGFVDKKLTELNQSI